MTTARGVPRPHHAPPDGSRDPEIATRLGELRAAAPGSLAAAALIELGLADAFAPLPSPLGTILVAWNGLGVSAVSLPSDERAFAARIRDDHGRPAHRARAVPRQLAAAIGRRLAGDRRARVPLDLRGSTAFEQAVWQKTLEIPHGEVRPYGWVASEIGRPAAVRAVGSALGHNPVPLVVPCHRVVRSDGTIGQYSMGGPESKRRILRIEGVDPEALESQAAAGIRYVGSATTKVVCHPTCRNARRIREVHRMPFRSLAAADAAGFRPCRVCRPAGRAAA